MTPPADFLTRSVFAAYAERPPEIIHATATTLLAIPVLDEELFRPWDASPSSAPRRRRATTRRRGKSRREKGRIGGRFGSLRASLEGLNRQPWSASEVGFVLVSVHSLLLWAIVLVAG